MIPRYSPVQGVAQHPNTWLQMVNMVVFSGDGWATVQNPLPLPLFRPLLLQLLLSPTSLMADQRSGDSWSCRRRGRSLAYLLGIVQTNNSEAAEYSVSTPVREFTGGRHVSYVSEIKMNWKVTSFVLTWIFSQSTLLQPSCLRSSPSHLGAVILMR